MAADASTDPKDMIRTLTGAAVELAAVAPDETEAVTQILLLLNQLYRRLATLAAKGRRRM